jgi:crotonobetainyl-CoA:carnitine CoA-transferase CaiB-like acyl-CoA transferase
MAALVLQNNAMVRVESVEGDLHADLRARLADLRARGVPLAEQAAVVPKVRPPAMTEVYYRTYATRDGAIAVACVSSGLQRAFMTAVGLRDEAHERPLADRDAHVKHYAALRTRLEPLMASRTTSEWKARLDAHGVPVARVALPIEMLDDEQALENGFLRDLDHPALGRVRVLAPPVRLDGGGFAPTPATPTFGSEARALLTDLGFTEAEIATFLAEGVTRDTLGGAFRGQRREDVS